MKTLKPDDLIHAIPKKITNGQIKASTRYWPSIDEISIEYTVDASPTKPFTAKVENVQQGKVVASPTVIPGSDMVNPGEKVKICMDRIIDGIPAASSLPMKNLSSIYIQDAVLGAIVSVQIYHIRSQKADAKLLEIIEDGITATDAIQARIKRGETTAVTNDSRISDSRIKLDKSALVDGKATVKLVKTEGGLEGELESYNYIPKIREEYTGRVKQGSAKAKVDWPRKIGVRSVELDHPADVTMNATVQIMSVGEEIRGRIAEYNSIPKIGEKITVNVKRGETSAKPVSDDYSVELSSEAVVGGNAVAIAKEEALPVTAQISEYQIVSEGKIVSARTESDWCGIATPYTGNYEILLDEKKEKKGFLKSKITRIDESGVHGIIEQDGIDLGDDDDEPKSPRNPFTTGNSSKNSLLSGRQL